MSAVGEAYLAPIARRIHARDGEGVTRMHSYAARAVFRAQRREQLHHLAVYVESDQALPARVEPGYGPRGILDGRVEGDGRVGLEAEEEPPDRAHEEGLERCRGEYASTRLPWLAEGRGNETACAEPDQEREKNAGREEILDPARGVIAHVRGVTAIRNVPSMSGVAAVHVVTGMSRMSSVAGMAGMAGGSP